MANTRTMPMKACVVVVRCHPCQAMLRPKPGGCCVFCSYGDVLCRRYNRRMVRAKLALMYKWAVSKRVDASCVVGRSRIEMDVFHGSIRRDVYAAYVDWQAHAGRGAVHSVAGLGHREYD
ncbi:MAG TPA: GDCCVxC domain-containing (seleno)protein [Roseiflexaceae bacterium]|nr:GDCCVxC domain-containing (seleno)protein [Roseiflexaceae bacterium]